MARHHAPPFLLGASTPAFGGPFRRNLQALFRQHGDKVQFAGMRHVFVHMVQLKHRDRNGKETSIKLHFYTELLAEENSNVACDECRIMGWHNHPVGPRRVHLIVPSEKTLASPTTLFSLMEMRHLGWMHRARMDWTKIAREKEDDLGDGTAEFVAGENIFFSKSHLLHAVLHTNGFGHICRVNGREGGASTYTGAQLMGIFNDLCEVLRARVISVEDVSNKLTMELRVLQPLAYGCTWYGRWGYSFGRGPFNMSAAQWQEAVRAAQVVKLSSLLGNADPRKKKRPTLTGKGCSAAVVAVLHRYRSMQLLENSPADLAQGVYRPVETVGDLIRIILDLIREPARARPLLTAPAGQGQKPDLPPLPVCIKRTNEDILLDAYNLAEAQFREREAQILAQLEAEEEAELAAKQQGQAAADAVKAEPNSDAAPPPPDPAAPTPGAAPAAAAAAPLPPADVAKQQRNGAGSPDPQVRSTRPASQCTKQHSQQLDAKPERRARGRRGSTRGTSREGAAAASEEAVEGLCGDASEAQAAAAPAQRNTVVGDAGVECGAPGAGAGVGASTSNPPETIEGNEGKGGDAADAARGRRGSHARRCRSGRSREGTAEAADALSKSGGESESTDSDGELGRRGNGDRLLLRDVPAARTRSNKPTVQTTAQTPDTARRSHSGKERDRRDRSGGGGTSRAKGDARQRGQAAGRCVDGGSEAGAAGSLRSRAASQRQQHAGLEVAGVALRTRSAERQASGAELSALQLQPPAPVDGAPAGGPGASKDEVGVEKTTGARCQGTAASALAAAGPVGGADGVKPDAVGAGAAEAGGNSRPGQGQKVNGSERREALPPQWQPGPVDIECVSLHVCAGKPLRPVPDALTMEGWPKTCIQLGGAEFSPGELLEHATPLDVGAIHMPSVPADSLRPLVTAFLKTLRDAYGPVWWPRTEGVILLGSAFEHAPLTSKDVEAFFKALTRPCMRGPSDLFVARFKRHRDSKAYYTILSREELEDFASGRKALPGRELGLPQGEVLASASGAATRSAAKEAQALGATRASKQGVDSRSVSVHGPRGVPADGSAERDLGSGAHSQALPALGARRNRGSVSAPGELPDQRGTSRRRGGAQQVEAAWASTVPTGAAPAAPAALPVATHEQHRAWAESCAGAAPGEVGVDGLLLGGRAGPVSGGEAGGGGGHAVSAVKTEAAAAELQGAGAVGAAARLACRGWRRPGGEQDGSAPYPGVGYASQSGGSALPCVDWRLSDAGSVKDPGPAAARHHQVRAWHALLVRPDAAPVAWPPVMVRGQGALRGPRDAAPDVDVRPELRQKSSVFVAPLPATVAPEDTHTLGVSQGDSAGSAQVLLAGTPDTANERLRAQVVRGGDRTALPSPLPLPAGRAGAGVVGRVPANGLAPGPRGPHNGACMDLVAGASPDRTDALLHALQKQAKLLECTGTRDSPAWQRSPAAMAVPPGLGNARQRMDRECFGHVAAGTEPTGDAGPQHSYPHAQLPTTVPLVDTLHAAPAQMQMPVDQPAAPLGARPKRRVPVLPPAPAAAPTGDADVDRSGLPSAPASDASLPALRRKRRCTPAATPAAGTPAASACTRPGGAPGLAQRSDARSGTLSQSPVKGVDVGAGAAEQPDKQRRPRRARKPTANLVLASDLEDESMWDYDDPEIAALMAMRASPVPATGGRRRGAAPAASRRPPPAAPSEPTRDTAAYTTTAPTCADTAATVPSVAPSVAPATLGIGSVPAQPEDTTWNNTGDVATGAATGVATDIVVPVVEEQTLAALPESLRTWCARVNALNPGECLHEDYVTDDSIRDQLMADLMCVYLGVMRTGVSENLHIHRGLLPRVAAAAGVVMELDPEPTNNVAEKRLRAAVRTMRQTKHFVKDYEGQRLHPTRPYKSVQMTKGAKRGKGALQERRFMVHVLLRRSCHVREFVDVDALAAATSAATKRTSKKRTSSSAGGEAPKRARRTCRGAADADGDAEHGAAPRRAGAASKAVAAEHEGACSGPTRTAGTKDDADTQSRSRHVPEPAQPSCHASDVARPEHPQACDYAGATAGGAAVDGEGGSQGVGPAAVEGLEQEALLQEEIEETLSGAWVTLPRHLQPPPPELVTISSSLSVLDLKRYIANSLKEAYIIFEKFQVAEVYGPGEPDGVMQLWEDQRKLDSFGQSNNDPVTIMVAGAGLDLERAACRSAAGEQNWVVSCRCGVRDDDGERMLCCEVCNSWHHAHCSGIGDCDPDPETFICDSCQRKPRKRKAQH